MTSFVTGRRGLLAHNADVVGVDARGTVHSTRKVSCDEENALRAWVKNWRVCLVDIGESGILAWCV